MRATVYVPIKEDNPLRPKNYIDAEGVDVDVATVGELLAELANTAPVRTRVIAYHRGTTHFQLTSNGWKTIKRVVM